MAGRFASDSITVQGPFSGACRCYDTVMITWGSPEATFHSAFASIPVPSMQMSKLALPTDTMAQSLLHLFTYIIICPEMTSQWIRRR